MKLRLSISTVSNRKMMLSHCYCEGNMKTELSAKRENLTSESPPWHQKKKKREGYLPDAQ